MRNANNQNDSAVYKKLSQRLYDLFFIDEHKYGRQVENGSYRLIKAKISPVTIDDMLLNGKSLLTYQESHTLQTAFIKWVCLDLDLDRKKMRANDASQTDEQNEDVPIDDLHKVKKAADQVSAYLTELGISHLQEFSGRRGFHVWIIFEVPITKEQGYQLAKLIATKVELDDSVNIDLFPKTYYVAKNSKGIGSGVKLPLSVHQKSGNLSYLLKAGLFDFSNYKFTELNDKLMQQQLDLLEDLELVSLKQITPLLEEYGRLAKVIPAISKPYLTKNSFKVGDSDANLDAILESLKACEHLKPIILNYKKELNPKERNIFVGLLAQLTTASNPHFGYELLLQLFSRVSGFRKDITEKKLKLSKYYYPVTCASLGRCEACECSELRSPIELHKDIQIIAQPLFSIDNITEDLFAVIVEAEVKYTRTNDEIPLYNRLEKLKNADYDQVAKLVEDIFNGKFTDVNEIFRFERNEINKVRTLYAIEPSHALVSTYFLYLLNNMFYTAISPNSFGYCIAPGFYNGNIFGNWFINWGAFSKNIQTILENEEYGNYFLVKVDIRNFYDRIDLQLLKVKLYEEALPQIDQRIKSLSENERKRYLNIVKFLIHISEQTVGSHIGLPQGPAYARYLAEFYLLGLDKMIEGEIIRDKRREFYYRFVDDIFIFVETEAKAKVVLEMVQDWSTVNALDLNPSKTELSSVLEYSVSGKFKKFQEDAKYAINQGNKNKELLSEEERQEVIAKVERLTDETKFGLKDNLRFFYYHFSADERLTHVKEKITRLLPFSDNGRGTLYMLLYVDLFEKKREVFWALAKEQEKISGLSLGHYLNTILLNFEEIQEKRDIVSTLIEGLSDRDDLSYADKSLILTLAMKFNVKPNPSLLEKCPEKLIFSVMETPNLEYNESNYDLLNTMLESKQEVEFIDSLYKVIHQHTLSPWVAVELARYALTRFSSWKGRSESSKLGDSEIALRYYHCICFLTLFDQNDNPVPVSTSWELLLAKSKEIELGDRAITFGWISNAIQIFSGKLSVGAFSLMLGDKSGSRLNTFGCENGFVPHFKDILLIFYFEKGTLSTDLMDKKNEVIDQDTLFGEWLFSPKTRLYPSDKDICVRNLALNGLIVLENDDEIFIKNINGHLQHDHYSYLEITAKNDDSEIVVSKLGSNSIPIFENATDLIELATKMGQQIQNDIEFRDTFVTEYPVYFKFPFQKESKPLIPFYATFSQKVSNEAINQSNDIKNYWENLLFIAGLHNEPLKLLGQLDNPFNFGFKEFSERLIPKSDIFIRTEQDILDFMIVFSKAVEGKSIKSIYDFQYHWSKVVWDMISERSKTNVRTFLQFVHIHFGTFNGGQLAAADILFGIDTKTKIEDQTLDELLKTVRNSFVSFQNNVVLSDFSIVELFDIETQAYVDALPEVLRLSDFKKTKLFIKKGFDSQTGKDETKVMLEKDDLTELEFMVYDTDNLKFFNKKLEELNSSLSGRQYYTHKSDQKLYIIPIELQISNAFGRVEERYKAYKATEKSGGKFAHTFPSSEAYLKTLRTYERYKMSDIEGVLKNHYDNNTDIKSRVVDWLSLFNQSSLAGSKTMAFLDEKGFEISDLHRAILEVLSQHIAITDEDLAFFRDKIAAEQKANSVIFAVKDPRTDGNGLARLLEKAGFKTRGVDFDASYSDMITEDSLKDRCLVIATDITVSGTQTFYGLEYYNNIPETEDDLIKLRGKLIASNERYFKFHNIGEFGKCKANFLQANKIKFISPISTETFRDKIEGHPLLGKDKHVIESNRLILGNAYNLSGVTLDDNHRQIFYTLIKDIKLIQSIFTIREGYSKSVNDPGENNVILRVRSLPKEHIRLFSLESKNSRLSLLDYVQNWEKPKKKPAILELTE